MINIERGFIKGVRRLNIKFNLTSKIALIGEHKNNKNVYSLCYAIHKVFNIPLNNIDIYTKDNKFTIEMGIKYNYLIGLRPCEAEIIMLKSATIYHTNIIIAPCACNKFQSKIINYIKEFPILKRIETFNEFTNKDRITPAPGWVILTDI